MKKRSKRTTASLPAGLSKLGDLLPQLIAKYGLQNRRSVEEIDAAWKEAVGPPYNDPQISRVVGLRRGILEISVPHPAFVQELSFQQAELVRAMQAALPQEKIKKIKFTVQP